MPLALHVKFDVTHHTFDWGAINKVLKTSRNPAMFNSLSLKNNKKVAINLLFCLEKWQMGIKKVHCITVVHFSYPTEVQATEGDLLPLVTSFWPLHIHSALPAPPAVRSKFRIPWKKSSPLCVCVWFKWIPQKNEQRKSLWSQRAKHHCWSGSIFQKAANYLSS